MNKVFELVFFVRDNSGQVKPYPVPAYLILVPGLNSATELETAAQGMSLPENISIKFKHTKNVELADGCPFSLNEALFIKGYRSPNDSFDLENTQNLFYKPTREDQLKGRTYLILSTDDVKEVERQIWKHFDVGIRFTLSETSLREQSLNRRMYGGY